MRFMRSFIFVFIGALLIGLSSCWNGSKVADKKKGLVIVNVLDKEYFDDSHIKGSINIPFVQVKQDTPNIVDKDAEVVMYCSNYMCSASGTARKQLLDLGYKKVYVYEGGTAEWLQKGYPITGLSKKEYLKMKLPKPEGKQEDYVLSAEKLKKKMEENEII